MKRVRTMKATPDLEHGRSVKGASSQPKVTQISAKGSTKSTFMPERADAIPDAAACQQKSGQKHTS